MIKKALTRLQALQVEIGNASRPNLAKLKEEVEAVMKTLFIQTICVSFQRLSMDSTTQI